MFNFQFQHLLLHRLILTTLLILVIIMFSFSFWISCTYILVFAPLAECNLWRSQLSAGFGCAFATDILGQVLMPVSTAMIRSITCSIEIRCVDYYQTGKHWRQICNRSIHQHTVHSVIRLIFPRRLSPLWVIACGRPTAVSLATEWPLVIGSGGHAGR